jgi:DNA-directed RNA polymerase subunit M/transcription elongation factor TFIIS
MNCPRCSSDMVLKSDKFVCARCGISTATAGVEVIDKTIEPEGEIKTDDETKEIAVVAKSEDAPEGEGFPEEEDDGADEASEEE